MASEARTALAHEAYKELAPMMNEWRAQGETYRAIAKKLNEEGFTTRRGKAWNHVQVRLVLERQKAPVA